MAIYNGENDSFKYIVGCYEDYAREVIKARAIPDLRDGCKPVQRRIIYAGYKTKKSVLQKCATIVSDSMKLHPHGDSSVWGAFCLMTDENGTFNMPYFRGKGNLGHVWSSDPPAAYRYPKWMVHENMNDFFKDKEVMKLIPSEEGDGDEPVVLNAIYPVVLVNGTDGIAVSAGTKIPSFNFGDVIDLTVKYLEQGSLETTDIIVPDFPTGGILVKNDAELAKIMATGRGKLKIRAKVEVVGKEIIVKEVPFGRTVESIVHAVNNLNMREINKVRDIVGRDSYGKVSIECKSKNVVDFVLMELYRKNILQNVFASNILVTENEEPFILGVHDIIKKWSEWRQGVVVQKFEKELENIKSELTTLDYFIRLISNEEWKANYTHKAVHESKKSADAYLHEIFEDIPDEVCTWINGRAISAFNHGGTYAKRYDTLVDYKNFCTESLHHPVDYMVKELKELKQSKQGMFERKTVATYQDYKFSKVVDTEAIEDTSYAVYTLYKDGFLKKSRELSQGDPEVLCEIEACANSILIGFDIFGRILRVIGSEIEFTPAGEKGTYLPKYFDGGLVQDDYRILYLTLLDGKNHMLVYRDGFIGFFDTAEYYEKKKNTKIINNGVCLAVYDKLLEVYPEDKIPQCLLMADVSYEDKIRLAMVYTDQVPRRGRRTRARVITGNDIDMKFIKGGTYMELAQYVQSPERYLNKLKVMKGEFYGDMDEMVDGTYLDICLDYEDRESNNVE